jgi:hypothetical protein
MYMHDAATLLRRETFIGRDSSMSLIDHTTQDLESPAERQTDGAFGSTSNFRFVPKELAAKCRKLIDSYHAIHGYGRLPDMLWHSDARDIIECHRELMQVFKNASKSRGAKRANESFLLIATAVVSLEVLARDFAGWGKRFPAAKREAEAMLIDFPERQRAWFMDKYLYPSLNTHREMANALAPSTARPVALPS